MDELKKAYQELEELKDKVGYCGTKKELLKIRRRMYYLKYKYGSWNTEFWGECFTAIQGLNGIIAEVEE